MSVNTPLIGPRSSIVTNDYGSLGKVDPDEVRVEIEESSESEFENEYRAVTKAGENCQVCKSELEKGETIFTYCGNWNHSVHKKCKKEWDKQKGNCSICRQIKPRRVKATAGALPSCVPTCITCVAIIIFAGIGALAGLRAAHKL